MGYKTKKVSIRYILNKRAKAPTGSKAKAYPLYVQIAFNRQNTSFPVTVLNLEEQLLTEDEFLIHKKDELPPFHSKIESIVRYEANRVGVDNFSFQGFTEKLQKYLRPVYDLIWGRLAFEFREYLKDILTYREFERMEDYLNNNTRKIFGEYIEILPSIGILDPRITRRLENGLFTILSDCKYINKTSNINELLSTELLENIQVAFLIDLTGGTVFDWFVTKESQAKAIKKFESCTEYELRDRLKIFDSTMGENFTKEIDILFTNSTIKINKGIERINSLIFNYLDV